MHAITASFHPLLLCVLVGTTQAQDMSGDLQIGHTVKLEARLGHGPQVASRPPPDREQQRSLVARQYADLGQELGLDPRTYERLIDTFADLQLQALERKRSLPASERAQQRADAKTAELTAVRTLIGDAGLDRYHNYMATRFERARVRMLDERLAPQDKLEPERRQRLIELLDEYDKIPRDLSHPYGVDRSVITDLSQEELDVAGQLNMIAANTESLRRVQERNPVLAAHASQFLSAVQLAEFTRSNEEGAAMLARTIDQQRARLDPVKAAAVTQRIAEAQRDWTPMTGEITFELNVTIDDAEPVIVIDRRPNGASATIEIDDLSIEVTPTLLPRRSLRLAVVYFGELGGKRRQLEAPKSGSRYFGHVDEEPIEVVRTDVVHGRLKGHIVRTAVRVLE